jgi:hypothetical protein
MAVWIIGKCTLLLAWVAPASSQSYCEIAEEWSATAVVDVGGQSVPCSMLTTILGSLTANEKEWCAGMPEMGQGLTRAAILELARDKCCSGGATVCDAYASSTEKTAGESATNDYCVEAEQWSPDAIADANGVSVPCSMLSTVLGSFTADEKECAVMPEMGQGATRAQILGMTKDKCCNGGKSTCDAFAAATPTVTNTDGSTTPGAPNTNGLDRDTDGLDLDRMDSIKTCGDMKKAYQAARCCSSSPEKTLPFPEGMKRRRLSEQEEFLLFLRALKKKAGRSV